MKLSAHRQKNLDKRIERVQLCMYLASDTEELNMTLKDSEELLKKEATDLIHYAKTCYRKLR